MPRAGQLVKPAKLPKPTTAFTVTVPRDTLYRRVVAHCDSLGISAAAYFRQLAEADPELPELETDQ